jgi:hypothetical protein
MRSLSASMAVARDGENKAEMSPTNMLLEYAD